MTDTNKTCVSCEGMKNLNHNASKQPKFMVSPSDRKQAKC